MADSDDDELLAEAKRRIEQQLENPDPQTLLDLAIAYVEMGLHEDAVVTLEELLVRDPNHAEGQSWLVIARARRGTPSNSTPPPVLH